MPFGDYPPQPCSTPGCVRPVWENGQCGWCHSHQPKQEVLPL